MARKNELEFQLEMSALGRVVKVQRAERDWTQNDLAEKADVDRTVVSSIEAGTRDVKLASLIKIAMAFDLKASDLLSLSEKFIADKKV